MGEDTWWVWLPTQGEARKDADWTTNDTAMEAALEVVTMRSQRQRLKFPVQACVVHELDRNRSPKVFSVQLEMVPTMVAKEVFGDE